MTMRARALFDVAMAELHRRAPDLADVLRTFPPDLSGTVTVEILRDALRINAPWFEGLDDEERLSSLALAGFRLTSPQLRPCGGRDPFIWNLACSAISNANLVAMGFRMPKGALVEESCRTRNSDEVYERLKDIPNIVPTGPLRPR